MLPIGNTRNKELTDEERRGYNIVKEQEFVKSLGLEVNSAGTDRTIWENVEKKFIKNIKEWKKHNLTLRGRVNMARSHIASTIWYSLGALGWSENNITNLNDRYWRFIQKNGGDEPVNKKVCTSLSKSLLTQPISQGGLNAMDMPENTAKSFTCSLDCEDAENTE